MILNVNIDHVATLRNARGGNEPDVLEAALIAEKAGAKGIVCHLREDRRHIKDADVYQLKKNISTRLDLEMAMYDDIIAIALDVVPHLVTIVPEGRQELTTEGGLDVAGGFDHLVRYTDELRAKNIRVSLFVDPDPKQIEASAKLGADIVELHTGAYCEAHEVRDMAKRDVELERVREAAILGDALGLEMHAGHGLTFDTVESVAALPQLHELNIGHFLIGEAIFLGLPAAIREMRRRMDIARKKAGRAA